MLQLGKYQLHEEIGQGGFGTVYKATDSLDRDVAIKILKPGWSGDSQTIERFRREAKAAGELFHNHIATIIDFGEDEGALFLVMRYVDGVSLAELLREKGRIKWSDAVQILKQVAEGLDHAHQRGFIHRDVKPSNIIISEKDGAVLTDFGLVRAVESSGITTSGVILGTPNYIAPEIWEGLDITPAVDIYSLACVYYEMLTGDVLFDGKSTPRIITKHVLEGPSFPGKWPVDIPEHVEYVLKKALEKDVANRYTMVQELLDALEDPQKIISSLDDEATTDKSTTKFSEGLNKLWSKPIWFGLTLVLIIVILFGGGSLWGLGKDGVGPFANFFPTPTVELERASSVSPADEITPTIVADMNTHTPTSTTTPSPTYSMTLTPTPKILPSPTTSTLSEENAEQIVILNTFVGHAGGVNDLVFSNDGEYLVSASDDQSAILWDFTSGEIMTYYDQYTAEVRSVDFSPDGNLLAVASFDGTVKLWNVSNDELLYTLDHENYVNSVRFAPGGEILATGCFNYTAYLWDFTQEKAIDYLYIDDDRVRYVSFSPDGRVLATTTENQVALWIVNTGSRLRTYEDHEADVLGIDFSPDGQLIASASWDNTARIWRVSDGITLQVLKGHTSWVWDVAYSPDGKLLATGSEDKTIKLWRISDGALLATLNGHSGSVRTIIFSPNGNWIASGSKEGTIIIWGLSSEQ